VKRDAGQLARRAKAGDRSAFRALVEQTHRAAYRVALRTLGDVAEAEDAVQEAYLRVWNGRDTLRDPEAVHAWIYGTVRNVASKRARSRARRGAHEIVGDPQALQELARYLVCEQPGPEQIAAGSQLREVMMKLLDELDEKHRVVLLLRAADGMSYDELSETLGVPVGTVESRLHRARHKLLDKLERALGRPLEGLA
jgi:RNA polymerase sigma-70 factor (ECF subfamily)